MGRYQNVLEIKLEFKIINILVDYVCWDVDPLIGSYY
jgi:replication initiation and membrane attachment protein DnaB